MQQPSIKIMTTHRIVRIVAGFFILLSLSLSVRGSPLFHSANWLWFTAFVGANLFQKGHAVRSGKDLAHL